MASEFHSDPDFPIRIRHRLQPGDVGYLTYLHGILYAREYQFDRTFELYVAGPLSEFARRQDPSERIWIAELNGEITGSIAIVRASETDAQLRWLLVHPEARGHGLGKLLISNAVEFSRSNHYHRIFLWTVSQLSAAAALYRAAGFTKVEELTHTLWGQTVTEERYDLRL